MYIKSVPNRYSPPAILLRESYREGGRSGSARCSTCRTSPASGSPASSAAQGRTVIPSEKEAISILRSLPHGHVAAALGTARRIVSTADLAGRQAPPRPRPALAVSRILDPSSKLAAARALSPETAASSLGDELGLGIVDEEELYAALDWLAVRQPAIEAMLAKRHLSGGTLVLYDVTSSYMEGRCCPLARFGYNRDGKKGKLQIVYGLLCAPDGCPVAVEVFAGSTGDPATLGSQVAKLKQRFGLDHVVLVGDRGMITDAPIAEDIQPAGLDWITALRAPAIRGLLDGGAFQMSLFDDRDMRPSPRPTSRRAPHPVPQRRARRRARPQARGPGASRYGTVFEIAKSAAGYSSTPTTLVSFNYFSDGEVPLRPDADTNATSSARHYSAGRPDTARVRTGRQRLRSAGVFAGAPARQTAPARASPRSPTPTRHRPCRRVSRLCQRGGFQNAVASFCRGGGRRADHRREPRTGGHRSWEIFAPLGCHRRGLKGLHYGATASRARASCRRPARWRPARRACAIGCARRPRRSGRAPCAGGPGLRDRRSRASSRPSRRP